MQQNQMSVESKWKDLSRSQRRRKQRMYLKNKVVELEVEGNVIDVEIDRDIFEEYYLGDTEPLDFTTSPFDSDPDTSDLGSPFKQDKAEQVQHEEEEEMSDFELDEEAELLIKQLVNYSFSNKVDLDQHVCADNNIYDYSASNISSPSEIYVNNHAAFDDSPWMQPAQAPMTVYEAYEASPDASTHCSSLSPTTPRLFADDSFRSRCSVPIQNYVVPFYNEPTPEPVRPNFDRMDIYQLIGMRMNIEDLIQNHLVQRFAFNKEGCRYLQDALSSLDNKAAHKFISMLFDHFMYERMDLVQMSEDVYGNYFMQLLCERGTDAHHKELLNYFVYAYIVRLSRAQCGCRVLQKLICALTDKDLMESLTKCLQQQVEIGAKQKVLKGLLINQNAAHVLQVVVESGLEFELIQFIVDELNQHFVFYTEDAYACRIIQSVVAKYGAKFDLDQLFIDDNHLALARTKYGNYVIQCVIAQHKWYSNMPEFTRFRHKLIKEVFNADNILYLSKCKHGSHMLETCLRSCAKSDIDVFIGAVCAKRAFVLKEMMKHQFANYVPKTLMGRCSRKQKQTLAKSVHENINLNRHRFEFCSEFINECQNIKFDMDGRYHYYY